MSLFEAHAGPGSHPRGSSCIGAAVRAARAVGLAAVLTFGLTGCLNYLHSGDHYVPEALGERYPIKVTRSMARLDVEISGRRLSDHDRTRIASFAREYRDRAGGPMIVARPAGASNHVAAAAGVASIKRELQYAGIPPRAISYRVYPAGGAGPAAPVILTYERFEAVTPECGNWQTNLANTYANRPYPDFGCATQQNLAAMVADPRDLVEPRAMTPADGTRRDLVIETWRKGENTQSDRSKDDSGKVSDQGEGE